MGGGSRFADLLRACIALPQILGIIQDMSMQSSNPIIIYIYIHQELHFTRRLLLMIVKLRNVFDGENDSVRNCFNSIRFFIFTTIDIFCLSKNMLHNKTGWYDC